MVTAVNEGIQLSLPLIYGNILLRERNGCYTYIFFTRPEFPFSVLEFDSIDPSEIKIYKKEIVVNSAKIYGELTPINFREVYLPLLQQFTRKNLPYYSDGLIASCRIGLDSDGHPYMRGTPFKWLNPKRK